MVCLAVVVESDKVDVIREDHCTGVRVPVLSCVRSELRTPKTCCFRRLCLQVTVAFNFVQDERSRGAHAVLYAAFPGEILRSISQAANEHSMPFTCRKSGTTPAAVFVPKVYQHSEKRPASA